MHYKRLNLLRKWNLLLTYEPGKQDKKRAYIMPTTYTTDQIYVKDVI